MSIYYRDESVALHHGDCIEVMQSLPENSIDAIVTDPPYELSSDGKNSPNRVFAEMVLPKDSHLKALTRGEDVLPLLVAKVLELGGVGLIPSPTPAMPVGAVAFDDYATGGNNDVVYGIEGSIGVSGDTASVDGESQGSEHLGSFALKLADPSKLVEVVGKLGASFEAGRLGIGLGVGAAGLPGALHGCVPVVGVDDDVRFRDGALSDLVGAFRGASAGAVFGFDLRRGSIEEFTADGARLFAAILLESGAELVRAVTPTSGLPAVLESRRVCVVDDSANRAFTFDLIVHTQSISSVGFMGKAWDGSKIAYDVALWREALRVLKPGGHLLAFGGTRTWHRLAVAVEDAGFEIRDSIAWMYGTGFPKSMDVPKAIDKKLGVEPIDLGASPNWRDSKRNREKDGRMEVRGANAGRITAPASPEAQEWSGWGTALKPAFEPIVMARKPPVGTVVANVLEYGTGALNIDKTRTPEGRWPANITLDESQANSTGSATKFLYVAKASKSERPVVDGVTHPTVKPLALMQWLCVLVTPPGGMILDPFAGSGTTLEAARKEGFHSVGVERESEYLPLIQSRIDRS